MISTKKTFEDLEFSLKRQVWKFIHVGNRQKLSKRIQFKAVGFCSYFSYVYIVVFHKKNGSRIIKQKFYTLNELECMYRWSYEPSLFRCSEFTFPLSFFAFRTLIFYLFHPFLSVSVERQLLIFFILFINKFMNMMNVHTFSGKSLHNMS